MRSFFLRISLLLASRRRIASRALLSMFLVWFHSAKRLSTRDLHTSRMDLFISTRRNLRRLVMTTRSLCPRPVVPQRQSSRSRKARYHLHSKTKRSILTISRFGRSPSPANANGPLLGVKAVLAGILNAP